MTARSIEHREGVSFRVAGRTLSGRALVYGDTADMGDFRERFEPGAFGEVRTIPINLQHDRRLIVTESALLTDSARSLDVRADLPEGSAALALVRRGVLSGFSIEFRARSERREAGIRVVERADLAGLALVDRGAYPQSSVELRRGRRGDSKTSRLKARRVLRSRIPYDVSLACECLRRGGGSQFIPLARFSKVAGDEMARAINGAIAEGRDVLAVAGDYKRAVASASRGTLRATSTGDGLQLEIDLADGTVADELVAVHETAGIVARPLIDFDRSYFTDTERGREYEAPWLRAILLGSTDSKQNWPEAVIDEAEAPNPTADKIAALSKISRRNRLWF